LKIKENNILFRKVLSSLLVLMLMIGLMPAMVFATGTSETPVSFGEIYWNPDPEMRASGNTHVTIRAERWVNVPTLGYRWLPIPAFDLIVIYRYGDTQNRTPQTVRILPNEPGYDPNIAFFRPNLSIPTNMLEARDRIVIRRHHYIDDASYPSPASEWTHFAQHNFYVPATTPPTSVPPSPNPGTGAGGTTTVITDTAPPQVPFVTDHTAFISGFPDGSIQPNREITRAEVSMILFRMLESNAKHSPQANRFGDVQAAAWYAQAVNYLAGRDILTGFPDGNFRPNAPITRAELTAIMSRFFELRDSGVSAFSDVASTHWAIAYINNANNRGWVTGFQDGTFRPNNATTRAEAVTIMNRVLERTPNPATIDDHLNNIQLFNDLTDAHWAFYQIMEAAIEHDFHLDAQGLEIWERVVLPTR